MADNASSSDPIIVEIQDKISPQVKTKLDAIANSAESANSEVDKLKATLEKIDVTALAQLQVALAKSDKAAHDAAMAYLEQEKALNAAIKAETQAKTALLQLEAAQNRANKASKDAAEAQTKQAAASVKAKVETKAAGEAMEHFGFKTAASKRELLVLAHELSQGNYKRFAGSLMVLGEQTGIMSYAFSAAGVAVLAAVAALGAFVYYGTGAETTAATITRALNTVNGVAGFTVDSFNAAAKAVGEEAHTSIAASREVMEALTKTGQLHSQQIKEFAVSAQLLSRLTGESADDIAKNFEKATQAPGKYAAELDRQLNFLSTAQLEHIKRLEESGQKTEATNQLSHDLYTYLGQQGPAQLGFLSSAWHSVTKAISDANEALKNFANPDKATQLQNLQEKLAMAEGIVNYQATAGRAGPTDSARANASKQATTIRQQIQDIFRSQEIADGNVAAQEAAVETQRLGKAGLEAADRFLKLTNNVEGAKLAIEDFRRTYQNILKADPNSKTGLLLQSNAAQIEEALRRQYEGKAGRKSENQEASRSAEIAKIVAQLHQEADVMGLVGDERERALKLDTIDANLIGQKQRKLSSTERSKLDADLQSSQDAARLNKAAEQIYQDATAPLRTYSTAVEAATNLLANGKINQDQFTQAVEKAFKTYADASDPMREFNKGLDDADALLQKYGPALQTATQLQQVENEQLAKGNVHWQEQKNIVEKRLIQQQHMAEVQGALNALYSETQGKTKALEVNEEALSRAYADKTINLEQYINKLRELKTAQANDRLSQGNGSFDDVVTSNVGRLTEGYTNVLDGLKSSFGDLFVSLKDGFAESIGQAIVHARTLKEGLQDVAQTVLSQLITSLVKLGIQYVVNATLGETVSATAMTAATAESVAAAAATAAAWAAPAALVSAATFGAADIAGMTGLAAIAALSEGIAATSLAGFSSGGYTGNSAADRIAGVVHGKEFVNNAASTAQNRPLLEHLNRGGSASNYGGGLNVQVFNYGSSKIEVQQISETDVRIIAREESQKSVRRDAPSIVAADIANPNGTVSKAMNRHTQTKRQR